VIGKRWIGGDGEQWLRSQQRVCEGVQIYGVFIRCCVLTPGALTRAFNMIFNKKHRKLRQKEGERGRGEGEGNHYKPPFLA